jgi:hypothetical protein
MNLSVPRLKFGDPSSSRSAGDREGSDVGRNHQLCAIAPAPS